MDISGQPVKTWHTVLVLGILLCDWANAKNVINIGKRTINKSTLKDSQSLCLSSVCAQQSCYLQELWAHWHVLQKCRRRCSCKVSAARCSVRGLCWLAAYASGGARVSATVCESQSRSGAPLRLQIITLISFTADWTHFCAVHGGSTEICPADT